MLVLVIVFSFFINSLKFVIQENTSYTENASPVTLMEAASDPPPPLDLFITNCFSYD
jgi:hypothetical protein